MTTEDVLSSNELEARERIVIDIHYYDELGNATHIQNNPVRMDVSIRNSIYQVTTTEDFTDEALFGEGEKFEIETNGVSESDDDILYTFNIEKEDSGKFNEILIEKLATSIKDISLEIESETKLIEIKQSLLEFIFSHFEYIALTLPGLQSWITLPEAHSSVKVLLIDSAQILINKSIISCSESFILRNCILQASPHANTRPSLMVSIGGNADLSDIKVASMVYVNITASNADDITTWQDTEALLSNITIGFKDVERNMSSLTGNYDAIFTIAEISSVNVSGVTSLNDIPFHSLLRLENINKINITDITRITQSLPAMAPSLHLGNFSRLNISGIKYIGVNDSVPHNAFIWISKSRPDSNISISNVEMYKLPLISLGGISGNKLNIIDSSFIDSLVCSGMETSSIGNFTMSNVKIKTASLSFKALKLNLLSDSSIEADDTVNLSASETLNLTNVKIKAQNMAVSLGPEVSFHLKDSSILSYNEFKVDVTVAENGGNTSRVSFIDSFLTAELKEFNTISTLSFQDVTMKGNTLSIHKCSWCTLGVLAYCEKNSLEVILRDVALRSSDFCIFEAGNEQLLKIEDGRGNLGIQYNDSESPSSLAKIVLKNSVVVLDLNAASARKFSLSSEASVGSQVAGHGEWITLTPDLASADRVAFERLDGKRTRNMQKVQYGIIE
jgi:hypothetical protein